ncbi:MAG: hypothetical protein HYU84_10020 [Chloroflexi bacterium]|nr:hypothetical protein [Chloroflexota bacterium]MBI3169020.1 hypothetical protein [Chloroflexota bacterium]
MKKQYLILIAVSVLVLSQIMCSTSGDEPRVRFETSITITTYIDSNRNGVQDAGEDGLPGVPIRMEAIRGLANIDTSTDITRDNGQTKFGANYSVGGTSHCPIVTVSITPPTGMVSTSGSNEIEIRDWECPTGAPAQQDRSVSFGLAPTEAATATPTSTPTVTPSSEATSTSTPTATPVASLDGEVQADTLACRYGPGDLYLYQYGLIQGNKMQVLGRDIHTEWVYVQVQGYDSPCWVNAEYINVNGDIASLESVYPGKVNIPLSDYWPAPQNVYAARTADGKQVGIYWDEYILPDGEMESPDSPRYLAELWLCKDGKLTFTSVFAWQNNLLVDDEAGCSEPSSGVMYLVEKHGYSGPVKILWPTP